MAFTFHLTRLQMLFVAYYQLASEKDVKGEDFYNPASGYVKINEVDKALRSLEKAIKSNFRLKHAIEADPDFELLRTHARYHQFLYGVY